MPCAFHDGEPVWETPENNQLCLDCMVSIWHWKEDEDRSLHEFLGLTWEQYQQMGGGDPPTTHV